MFRLNRKKSLRVNPFLQKLAIMSQFHLKPAADLLLAASILVSQPLQAEVPEQRIVTVGGAATEIVFALGAGDKVVAVDLSSTYPSEVRQLPQVGYIRNISPEGILSLKPDIVVATEALGPPAAKDMMKQINLPVVWLPEPDSYAALAESLTRVGNKLDRAEKAAAIRHQVEQQLAAIRAKAKTWPAPAPRVLFFLQPPAEARAGMASGTDTRADALIQLAGGRNAGTGFTGFKEISTESIIKINPDVIFVALSDGHGGSPQAVENLKDMAALKDVNAIKKQQVYGVPLDDLTFGPRLGEAATHWNDLIGQASKVDG